MTGRQGRVPRLRLLLFDMLFPWDLCWIGLAFFSWHYLTPAEETMAVLEPGWIGLIWLRNAALLMLVAGRLHWWLYVRCSQHQQFNYNTHWPVQGSRKFLWKNQVKDNMFWSLTSGCTLWLLYEALPTGRTLENPALSEWADSTGHMVLMLYGVFFWSTFHFYVVHRLLHWTLFTV